MVKNNSTIDGQSLMTEILCLIAAVEMSRQDGGKNVYRFEGVPEKNGMWSLV